MLLRDLTVTLQIEAKSEVPHVQGFHHENVYGAWYYDYMYSRCLQQMEVTGNCYCVVTLQVR